MAAATVPRFSRSVYADALWQILSLDESDAGEGLFTILNVKNSFLQVDVGCALKKSASFPSFDMDRERTEIRNQAAVLVQSLKSPQSQDVCRYRDHGAECQSPATTEKSTDAASGDFPESGPQHPDVSAEGDQVVQSMTQTSLVLRNIPSDYTRQALLDLFRKLHILDFVNFLYFPIRGRDGSSLGYAFVNVRNLDSVAKFTSSIEGWPLAGRKGTTKATVHANSSMASLDALINRYRDSSIMHSAVPVTMKPMLLHFGAEVPFPPPRQALSRPSWLPRGKQDRCKNEKHK
mmetsp:Transcript_52039/g.122131  ORF Transcript_52039/g.122131 Transcript_52039/m.122131 type:complete len:291 (-) Transcript_52039:310-1182(-)